MRLLSLLCAVLLTGTVSASATDWRAPVHAGPFAQPDQWTGLYFGGHVGAIQVRPYIDFPIRFDSSSGAVGGLMLGYMGQNGPVVGALEADIGATSVSESSAFSTFGVTVTGRTQLDWFGTIRGRAGYLVTPDVLLYGAGGFAFGRVSDRITVTAPGAALTLEEDNWHWGWTIGAGIEAALAPNWLVRAEYLYYDLGKKRYWASLIPPGAEIGLRGHVGRVAANYRF